MEANELRIGNYILYKGQVATVNGIMPKILSLGGVREDGKDLIVKIDNANLEPLPLTEERLIELGFKEVNNAFKKGGFLVESGVVYRWNHFSRWVHLSSEIKYVHQLQNLYFALTGKELETKQ